MKITRSIKHHVNMGNYEWTEIEASIEVEIKNNIDRRNLDKVDDQLRELVASDLHKAARLSDDVSTYSREWLEEE